LLGKLKLQERFLSLWSRLSSGESSLDVWNIIEKNYSEKHRHYHNLNHIAMCLEYFDRYCLANQNFRNKDIVETALWFHDIVYNPTSSTNEEDSAELFYKLATIDRINENFIKEVKPIILYTKNHEATENIDRQIALDCDLSIFASEIDILKQYDINIRNEYSFVEKYIYQQKRKQILMKFLEKDRIYNTNYFRQNYEHQARENLKYLIKNI
jgi:predicted metal-dependent HD superfamily phosphohydrolase